MISIKHILISFLLLSLISCDSGSNDSDTANNDSNSVPVNLDYGSSWVFPHEDNIEFQRQDTGDVIALSDNSLWYITGTHSSGNDVLNSHDITIYTSSDNFSDPTSGVRSPYYMYIDGSSRSFYVSPIVGLEITVRDTIEFQRETTGSLIALTDGTLWNVKGTHSSGSDVLDTHYITVYTKTNLIPTLSISGQTSDYYMYILGASRGFYIEPISDATVLARDTIVFNRQDTGDTLALSDGSLWIIKGTHSSGSDVLDSHDVSIYSNTASISVPNSGERSNYYMYISGSSRGFFVEPL